MGINGAKTRPYLMACRRAYLAVMPSHVYSGTFLRDDVRRRRHHWTPSFLDAYITGYRERAIEYSRAPTKARSSTQE